MEVGELKTMQAAIRDKQRERMDDIHAPIHDLVRDLYRKKLRGEVIDENLLKTLLMMNNLCHDFMWDFDHAVMIHERIAELTGGDVAEATSALWSVRTEREEG